MASDFKFLDHNSSSESWTLEDGYSTSNPTTYPHRVLGPGARAGLNIVLKLTEPDLDYICRGPVQGFKILLHTPGEIPRVSKQYFRVPQRQEVVVSVKPNMITTSEGLADYAPERRQCYFNKERDLKFFKVYTQSNCELECLANFTLGTDRDFSIGLNSYNSIFFSQLNAAASNSPCQETTKQGFALKPRFRATIPQKII